MRIRLWAALWTLCLLGGFLRAAGAGEFDLGSETSLTVRLDGVPLIVGDAINYAPGWEGARTDSREVGALKVVNVTREDDNTVQYRREAAVGRGLVEITAKFRLFSYANTKDRPSISYTFRIPWERLKNTTATAFVGRGYEPERKEMQLGATHPDGLLFSQAHTVAFKGDGLRLMIDLNPEGLGSWINYGSLGFLNMWTVTKRGEFVEFSAGGKADSAGGVYGAKALLFEGDCDWDGRHTYSVWHYYGSENAGTRFAFGATGDAKDCVKADLLPFAADRAFGWEQADGLRLTTNAGKGLVANAAVGRGERVFAARVTPGIYAVNLKVGGVEAGPFSVRLEEGGAIPPLPTGPGGPRTPPDDVKEIAVARALHAKAGAVSTVHLWKYVRSGHLRVIFDSADADWAVSTLHLQPILYATEDFAVDRGAWLADGLFIPED